jgi:hypothetical protein
MDFENFDWSEDWSEEWFNEAEEELDPDFQYWINKSDQNPNSTRIEIDKNDLRKKNFGWDEWKREREGDAFAKYGKNSNPNKRHIL